MDDLVQIAGTPLTEETSSPRLLGLTDFRAAVFAVAPAEVWKLVETFLSNPDRRRGWRWAVLADQPDHVGLVTLFQHRGKNISMDVEVFATEKAAIDWLLSPRSSDV